MNDTVEITLETDDLFKTEWQLECRCSLDADGTLDSIDQVVPLSGVLWVAKRGLVVDVDTLDACDTFAVGDEIADRYCDTIRDAVEAELRHRREAAPYAEAERKWELKTGR